MSKPIRIEESPFLRKPDMTKKNAEIHLFCLKIATISCIFNGFALAHDVSPTKTTASVPALESAYSFLELRSYSEETTTDDQVIRRRPITEIRSIIGSTFYQEKLDVFATLTAFKPSRSTQFKRGNSQIEAEYRLLRGTYGSLVPKASVVFPEFENDGNNYGNIGFYSEALYPVSLGGNSQLTLISSAQGLMRQAGQGPEKMEFRTDKPKTSDRGTYLTAPETTEYDDQPFGEDRPEQEHASYETEYSAGFLVSFKSVGINFSARFYGFRDFNPTYRYPSAASEGGTEEEDIFFAGYRASNMSLSRYLVSFKLSPTITIYNDFYHFFDGIYEKGRTNEGPRYVNRLTLSARLF